MSKLRIVPLGGLGEIGKNMTAIEYEDEILIIDAGIMFPENDMLGIDLIIPDYNYLKNEDKLDNVVAILLTHGHEDHVGALPHVLPDLDAPIYATPLTAGLVEVKLKQAKLLGDADIHVFEAGDVLTIGQHFSVEPFHVTHSIPDCVGFGITTPVGLVVHTGDYKFDHTPVSGWPPDFAKLAEFSQRGVLCLLADSTNAERPGWTPSEQVIAEAFDDLFRQATGRIIIATFASLISRIQQVADTAIKHGRKLSVTGRSMRDNVKMARRLGYLEIPDDLLIDIQQAATMAPDKVAIMATGSQGEPSAVLGRLARGRHKHLKVKEGDTIVFSAYPIPGNEELIHRTINHLFRRGANVMYHPIANVHVSGHASQEEMKLMINLVKPKYLVPIHGELRHLRQHATIARQIGMAADNIAVVENGTPLELDEQRLTILPRMPGGYIFVDGASVGEIGWPVVNDREKLARAGIFVAAIATNSAGEMIGKPDMILRGFVSRDRVDDIKEGAEEMILRTLNTHAGNRKGLTAKVEGALNRYLYDETGIRPLIHVIIK